MGVVEEEDKVPWIVMMSAGMMMLLPQLTTMCALKRKRLKNGWIPTMTALENVALPLEFAGRGDAFEAAQSALERVGLAARLAHYPAQLSGGEQQMCAIGRALMAKPSMILLDEPSMGLAPQIVEEIFGIVQDLNQREQVSFLLAEQNTTIALKYADFGYILENGRVVMEGAATDLAANEDVKEFYLGMSGAGRKSFRDMKFYRRRKRWLA